MSLRPNRRVGTIQESKTLAVAARAKAMQDAGEAVISLGAGEPDFDTVDAVAAAGVAAIERGDTRYTAAAGTPKLRAAAATWFRREFGLEFGADQVLVSAGAKPAIHMAMMSVLEPGDVVLLLSPYWVSYPAIVHAAGGRTIELPAVPEQGFIHTGDQVRAAAHQHGAVGIILNYPNNPSGAAPTRAQMQDMTDAIAETGMWILSDEIYAKLLYDGRPHVSPASFPAVAAQTMVVNGGTKSHTLTGWRVGLLAGPQDIIAAASRLQSQVIGNACTISQAACLEVCTGDHEAELRRRMDAYSERRAYLVQAVSEVPGMRLAPPDGAFYALVDARKLCATRGEDDHQLAESILQSAKVAVVPGSAFAIPGFLRLSYAAGMDELREAMRRLREFAS